MKKENIERDLMNEMIRLMAKLEERVEYLIRVQDEIKSVQADQEKKIEQLSEMASRAKGAWIVLLAVGCTIGWVLDKTTDFLNK